MQLSDRFQGILAFIQAVECGSFSVASRQMGMSPSSVGKAVARLEQRLGVRLFVRTTRRMSLTDEGVAFHESCLRALAELDQAESVLTERRLLPSGRVRIALPTLYGRERVLPILMRLAEHYPALDLDVQFSSRAADLVEENIDLAVRIGQLDDSASHVARPLGEQTLWLCAAPDYLARRGTPRTLDDLRDHDCIARLRNGMEEVWQFGGEAGQVAQVGQARHLPRQARLRLSDLAAVKDAALAGRGLAQLPGWFAERDIRAGRLAVVLPDAQPAPLPIHVLWSRTTRMTARLRVTIDALAAHASQKAAPG
ncbi:MULTISPECIES: LysR family transcriptional regulator [Burkholderia]|uniref:LysR family transcriptional regulator n=1 Tax=Burkholderia aenigmatica TaxID=2015348 RepID=A0A6J5IPR1_9BURK|nr:MULTISPECIES: LysR family transcriptional regulator [Burkholderia]CAB3962296.1 LysR family transcriptional regulator [Burkholderia aenigmatica]